MKKAPAPKESPKTMKAEIGYMKKGGAPKSLLKHEQAEHQAMAKMKKSPRSR
jgi:hypothetical protein